MRYFADLRTTPWFPTFDWLPTPQEAADKINIFHEDYPQRVQVTEHVIASFRARRKGPSDNGQPAAIPISCDLLLKLHGTVFKGEGHEGNWRRFQNRIADHVPPPPRFVPGFMDALERPTAIRTINDLEDWYWDFNTIHPFLDGNGRVSGIIVATFSHMLHPDKGWLSPNQ